MRAAYPWRSPHPFGEVVIERGTGYTRGMSRFRRLVCVSIGGFLLGVLLGVPAYPIPARPLPTPPNVGLRVDGWEAEDGLLPRSIQQLRRAGISLWRPPNLPPV